MFAQNVDLSSQFKVQQQAGQIAEAINCIYIHQIVYNEITHKTMLQTGVTLVNVE